MAGKRSKAGYDGKIAGLYDLEDTIGQGHFAVVKLARHVFTGEKVAVKVIDKTKLDEVSRSHLFQEVRCMKLVQHPNVVRLYEVIDTQTKLYLILELGDGGDMYDYIMKHPGGLEEKLAKRYFRQIVEAISYCHKLHVVHRDLKPENVVFFEKLGLVKLTDFGFSNMFAPGKKLETSCGSLAYSAPEILLGDSYDAPAVDVWSLGVILYMLVVGVAPFQEANDSETLTMIMDCRYHVPSHISAMCRELIGQMLQREPVNRASLAHIMAHPWLNDGDLTPVSTFLPLITKEMISEADRTYVVQKMVEGSIASREEILSSIEKDSYNHITATYYLLIERRLRKHQQHEHHLTTQQLQQPSSGILRKQSTPSPSKTAKPQLEPLMLSPRRTSASATVSWDGLLSPPPTQSVSFSDEISKQKELKKTKTAPVPAVLPSPIISISSPVEEPRGGAGACFVKRLTTSMTLDRRKTDKATSSTSRLGAISPMKLSPVLRKLKPDKPAAAAVGQPSSLMIHSVVMSKSDPGEDSQKLQKAEKPQRALKVSVLTNFFEQKAKEGGRKGKGRKFNLGCMRARNRPTDVIQEIPGENADAGSSQYVQSLVSPPGTHPSTSTSRQLQPSSSTEPVGSLMVPPGAARKCSLIKEESYDEYDDEEEEEYDMDAAVIKPVKSLESLDDFATNPHASVPLNVSSSASSSPDPVNPRRPLKSVCSSPQLLNQIHEENESEDEDEFDPLKIVPRRFGGSTSSHHHRENSSASPEILRKYEQRKKRRGACQRGTSCSSSDASDTDDTEGRSRKDKLRHRFIHRRDSSDHSSDTDGPGGSIGGNGRLRTSGGSNASQGSYSHSGSGGGGSGGGGGGGGGKSEKKEGSDKNQSNNKTNSSHHKNNRHCSSGFGGSKGSLTDTSLKILSRKLSDISTGVGALLTDCRGSDCDNDSSPHKTPSTPHSPDHNSSICSGTLPRHSRNTSFRSNSSTPSRLHSDSALFVVSEAESHSIAVLHASPVQYLGRSSTEVCCVCGPCHCQSLEFSQICSCVSEGDSMPGEAKRQTQSKKVRASPCRSADLSCGALHCKPSSGRVSVVPVESKCCSVV